MLNISGQLFYFFFVFHKSLRWFLRCLAIVSLIKRRPSHRSSFFDPAILIWNYSSFMILIWLLSRRSLDFTLRLLPLVLQVMFHICVHFWHQIFVFLDFYLFLIDSFQNAHAKFWLLFELGLFYTLCLLLTQVFDLTFVAVFKFAFDLWLDDSKARPIISYSRHLGCLNFRKLLEVLSRNALETRLIVSFRRKFQQSGYGLDFVLTRLCY